MRRHGQVWGVVVLTKQEPGRIWPGSARRLAYWLPLLAGSGAAAGRGTSASQAVVPVLTAGLIGDGRWTHGAGRLQRAAGRRLVLLDVAHRIELRILARLALGASGYR